MRNSAESYTLQETLAEDLQKLLSMEKTFMMTLPSMAQSATHSELQEEFERLCCQTREQIERLNRFVSLPPNGNSHTHHTDDSIYEQHEVAEPPMKDCMLIAEARKKQHEKIALYSTVCVWAHQLGLQEMENALNQNLREEETDCEKLLQLAQEIMCPSA